MIYFFLLLIIALLIFLILRIDYHTNTTVQSDYNINRLSLEDNKEEEKEESKSQILSESVKSVVGISKLHNAGNSIFLNHSEEKLGIGSGIIITDNGYILTNYHVAGNKYSNCYVTLETGNTYNGTVVWVDSNLDLAIVKISANQLKNIKLADSDKITLAEDVYAIGNPIGFEFQRTVTKGIISGINRTIKIEDSEESSYMEDLIQTDATINEGNSGGALINEKGELIGVNTVKIGNAEGIGFAVPINIVKPIIDKLVNQGKFEEAYLGIYGYDKEVIPYLDSNLRIENGVYIAKILQDGPFYNTDIQEGDIILKVGFQFDR